MSASLFLDGDFRRLWTAGLIGYLVRWLEVLVFGVYTYQVTGSAFMVASMVMLRLLPLALLGVPFGALAALVPRRTGLVVSLAVLCATSSALAIVAWLDRLEVWHLAAAAVVNGITWAADNPFRRGLIGDIAGTARMGAAMALDVGASNASRLAGPLVGGLLLARHGMEAVMALVAVLQAVALVAVLRAGDRPMQRGASTGGLVATLSAGFVAARASPRLAGTLWITVMYNLFGWPALSMVPVIGKDRLGLGADGVGLLASVDGVGTLVGALTLALVSRPALYGRLYVGGVVLFLLTLPLFALATDPRLAGAALFVAGLGQSAFGVMQATLVFVSAPPDRRAQAMGLLTMCIGTGPIGFLMLGGLADRLGAPAAVAIAAVAGLAVMAATRRWWRACWLEGRGDGR
jgi:MFS family permease